jgi:hypothetical protein
VKNAFDAFCQDCFDFLSRRRVRFLVIGGLAVMAVGEPRVTGDAHVVVFGSSKELERLIVHAPKAGFQLDQEGERRRFRETGTLRFLRRGFQLDLIAASLPFEEAALARASRKRMFGRLVRLPTPEDLLLFKVLAGRDKDMLDAVGIVRRHRGVLDLGYVRTTLRPICDLAEDMSAWRRLERVTTGAAS